MGSLKTEKVRAVVTSALVGACIVIAAPTPAQMMGGDHMTNMRQMMQGMMAGSLPPGIDPGLLPEPRSKASRLLTNYCAQCHNLPGPGMHTADEWPNVVNRMRARMDMHGQMMGGISLPTRSELQSILTYLQKYAIKPIESGSLSRLNTTGGKAFRKTCAQCHALPDPKQHTSQEWPTVVARMQKNMSIMGKTIPDGSTARDITEFLKVNGR